MKRTLATFYPFIAAFLLSIVQQAVAQTAYRLCVWTKDGVKDGYLFADKPEFRLDGDVVRLWTGSTSVEIAKGDLDKFTLEQVQPGEPTGISLPATLTLGLKRSALLSYVLQPADASTSVTWLNSAPAVLSVGGDGQLTALQPGEATVRAQTSNGLRAACLVTVPVPAYKLIVWTTNGRSTAYSFADKPEITISGDIFTVTTTKTTMGYAATDIKEFTLLDASWQKEDVSFADTNGDGTVDVADIATIITVMAQGDKVVEQVIAADVNGDGVVDVADIATIISVMAGQ